MPKIRDHKRPAVQALVVSPWQTKHGAPAAAADASWHSVVTSETLLSLHQDTATPQSMVQQPHRKEACAAPPEAGSGNDWHQRPPKPQQQPTTAPSSTHAAPDAGHAAQSAMELAPENSHQQRHNFGVEQHEQQGSLSPEASVTVSSSSGMMTADLTEQEDLQSPEQQLQKHHPDVSDDWLDTVGAGGQTAAADTAAGGTSSGTAATPTLQGVAQLLLLPSGAICGHFVSSNAAGSDGSTGSSSGASHGRSSRRLCLGLQSRQVLSAHSCYRDAEWALLQLSIIRYDSRHTSAAATAAITAGVFDSTGTDSPSQPTNPSLQHASPPAHTTSIPAAAADIPLSLAMLTEDGTLEEGDTNQAEAIAWVQRTGGDLVTLLPADMDDEDTEVAVLADNLGELPVNVEVNFTAHTLLAGGAAAEVLCTTWPEQAEPDVVVNLGDMSIAGLPHGFLC